MNKKKKPIINEKRKLRDISDYMHDCLNRLYDHADLLLYLGKHKDYFVEETSKRSLSIVISMVDVYSRDTILIFGAILDDDRRTSSLYTMTDHIKDENKRKKYIKKLDTLKKSINQLVRARGGQVAHFNSKLNIPENGFLPVNVIFEVDPNYTKKQASQIENYYWRMRQELSIEGTFVFSKEPIVESFKKMIGI